MKKIVCCFLVVSLLQIPSALASFDPSRNPSVPSVDSEKTKPVVQRAPSPSVQNSNRRISYGFRSRAASSYSNKTQNQDITTLFTSEEGFSVVLPNIFKVVSDDLSGEEGSYVLSDEASEIRVEATNKTCPIALIALRNCLGELIDDIHQKKLKTHETLKRKEKREFVLDQEEATKKATNIAIWTLSQVGDEKIGVLVFIEKNSKKVWTLSIQGKSTAEFFKQPRYLLVLTQSLAMEEKENRFGSYQNNLEQKVTNTSVSQPEIRTRRTSRVSIQMNENLKKLNTYTSQDESLTVELPTEYTVMVDTLGEEEGKLEFKKNDQSIVFMPLEEICPIKTERTLYQSCVKKMSDTLKQSFETDFPGVKILKEENKNLNLGNGKYSDDFVRVIKWFNLSKRYAQIVFVHPEKNQMWFARMYGTDKRGEILTDAQVLEKALKSLRLK